MPKIAEPPSAKVELDDPVLVYAPVSRSSWPKLPWEVAAQATRSADADPERPRAINAAAMHKVAGLKSLIKYYSV